MRPRMIAVAAALALAGTGAPALAQADCTQELMAKAEAMIEEAEKTSYDKQKVDEAKRLNAEAKRLYQAGDRDAAVIRIVRSMMFVDRTTSGGR